jgi:uncharacterized protein YkwD
MKRTGFSFIAGVLTGAVLFGGSVAVAAGIIATPTASKVLVNGEEVAVEAYNIHNNNFFMLRDVADAVDFSVVWDGDNNRVLIDTTRGYDPNETYAPGVPTEQPVQSEAPEMTDEEMKLVIAKLTNIERVKAGLPELDVLPELMESAQAKAQDFIDNGYYGHISPEYGTPGEMVRLYVPDAKLVGENLTAAAKDAVDTFYGWIESSEHYNVMISPKYTHIGVGVVELEGGGRYWVQQFVSF